VKRVRRAALVTGRNRRSAIEAIDAFRSGHVDVLVSTDLAAEGLNLQRAGVVVHYDIPWNPMKLEQRNGRAHRIGQTRERVKAVYFLPQSDDTGIVFTMSRKNRERRGILRSVEDRRPRLSSLHLRPRVQPNAAIVKLIERVHVPDLLVRRHREGVERLLAQLAGEYLDDRKLRDLEELLQLEPWARSRLPGLGLL
jgi:superfamily II DNA/RNA helicase